MSYRVTQNLLSNTVLNNLNYNLEKLLNTQSHLSSGKRISRPSDDPVGTSSAMRLRTRLSETEQYLRNMEQGETQLNSNDAVFDDMSSLLMRAQDLAIQQANVTADDSTRSAVAEEVNALLSQFVDLLNTQVSNRYIFGGFESLSTPFVQSETGITYQGDSGEFNIEIESGTTLNTNVAGSVLLPSVVDDLGGHSSLHAYAERSVSLGRRNLVELNNGTGVDQGFIQITNLAGQVARIDLREAKTLDEVAFRISNANDVNGRRLMLRATVDEQTGGLVIEDTSSADDHVAGQGIVVEDLGNGRVARQLGIKGETASGVGTLTGRDLAPLELTTRLEDLNGGSGVELGGFRITDRAGNSAVVDISEAATLEDVRELISQSGTNILAQINTGGNGLLLLDGSSGTLTGNMEITEVGTGTSTAADLGILTPPGGTTGNVYYGEPLDPRLTYDTPISLLNRGQGFDLGLLKVQNGPLSGEIDFSRAATVGDLIDTINSSGLDLKARINELGTGIAVTSTVGGRTLTIENTTGSFTARLLGIEGSREVLVEPVNSLGQESNLLPALDGRTRLQDINSGSGVPSGVIRITDSLGNSLNIDITGVNTVQGVLNLINEVGAEGQGLINVVAELSPDLEGISIIDQSIPNTVIREDAPTGRLGRTFADIEAGDTLVVNVFDNGSISYASNVEIVGEPALGEIAVSGEIETIDRENRTMTVRSQDGTLYGVTSQQPIDNYFIGQWVHMNGDELPSGEFSARTVAMIEPPVENESLLRGVVQSVDEVESTVTLLLGDGTTRTVDLVTGRGLVKVEDISGDGTAAALGILGSSIVGSDRITGDALNPLISRHTDLSLLNGGTFSAGKVKIANGDREVVLDLSQARTVGDMITLFNSSPVGVVASINSSGTGISLRSRINGTTLVVSKIALTNPDGSKKVNQDGTVIFDETADILGISGSEDVLGNLLFLKEALLNNSQEDIQRTLDQFPEALNRVLNQRTKTGARVNQLDTTSERGLDSQLSNKEILSSVEDLDVVEAVSELAAQENAFNAALSSASRIIQPSLLDFL